MRVVGAGFLLAILGLVTSSTPAAPAAPDEGVIAFASNRAERPCGPPPHRPTHPLPRKCLNFDIYTIRADGTGLRRLTSNPAYDDQPAWSPDGGQLAFVRGRDRTHLCVMTLGRRGARCFRTEFELFRPAWSPRGDSIAYVSYQPPRNRIVLLDPRSGARRALPGVDNADLGGVSWSPDGMRIVFGSDGALESIDVASGAVTELTASPSRDGSCIGRYARWPAWSPDGRSIVFWSRPYCGDNPVDPAAHGLFEVDPTVGEPSVQKLLPDYLHPAWSPDGRRLAADFGVIWVANVDGGGFTRLTHVVGRWDEFPAWRP